jgi:hypothetical protein
VDLLANTPVAANHAHAVRFNTHSVPFWLTSRNYTEVDMSNIRSILLALSLCVSVAIHAQAELGTQLKIADQVLQLNGAGTRTKTFVQIYESGLYLLNPSKNAQAILEADELMAIRIRITSGFVSRASLVASLQEGLVQSTGGKTSEIAKETEQFIQTLRDEVNKNDVYDFVHVQGKGLYIVKNGTVLGVVPGMAFKKALFGIWLSDSPVDKELRQAMLSGRNVR